MCKNPILIALLFFIGATSVRAQYTNSYVQEGEFGLAVGAAHYFGDLNTRAKVNRPKPAIGVFFRKQFSNYIGVKLSANYAQLGYADKYSDNATQQLRNLSFNTSIWELGLTGEFNFFKFYPGSEEYRYTPYVSLGVAIFSFDPYTYYNNEKYYLRNLGTEGQGSTAYPDRKPYGAMAMAVPLSVGFKYNLNEKTNIFLEAGYRFTRTDYLDDVSTTYAPDAFTPLPNGQNSIGYLLQDRSYELGQVIGVKDRQRGNSQQKDAYAMFQIGVSFNLSSYRCPSPN
jgi:hypothetical protein